MKIAIRFNLYQNDLFLFKLLICDLKKMKLHVKIILHKNCLRQKLRKYFFIYKIITQ